ncbi:transcriptional regulator, LysR family [Polaromonas sp. OV174]|uniref:LysR family transcriptional regulator n=1 Tax=Polaromonas sp. OV174 TaxID=1855300 RepID=UPI0008E9F48A|nr:LysR family transcriptional regulator [Polaromonas sp. OV174]SFC67150.1 transcriptional regulator, LysR family [Polaromonas sp. OV174]
MRDLDMTTLRLFAAVCETRSIARAAEQANIVGSAISKRLAQLEDTVGTPLLLRRRRGVEPTPAGESLLEHARTMLASAERIERDMAAYAQGVRGQVRILATASVMAESLADDVAAFLQVPAHHDIQVDMEERISPDVVRGIREGVASVGICWDAADLRGLQSCSYRSDHLAIVVHPSHPLAAHETLSLEQTLDYEHVSLPVSSAVQVLLQRAAALKGKVIVHRVIVSNFEAAMRVVRANLAISVVPREVAEPYAATYGLCVLPLLEPWAKRRFAICYRDESGLSAAAQLLVRHLAARAGAI